MNMFTKITISTIIITVSTVFAAGIDIIANWPQQIGLTQTGCVEFVSVTSNEYSLLLESDPSNVLASVTATSTYSVISFSFDGHIVTNLPTQPVKLVDTTSSDESIMPRPFAIVSNMTVDMSGKVPTFVNGTELKFKLKGSGTAEALGNSLYISGSTSKSKLSIKAKGGIFTIPYIEIDKDISSIQVSGCSVDEIHVKGGVKKVTIKNGSLGYEYEYKLAKIAHGLNCEEPTAESALKLIKIQGDTNNNFYGMLKTPLSYKNSGVNINVNKGTLKGNYQSDIFSNIKAYEINDSWFFATDVDKKGTSIKSISSKVMVDSALQSGQNVTNAQTIFVAGMEPEVFWQNVSSNGTFAGIIPKGIIKKLKLMQNIISHKTCGAYIIGDAAGKKVKVPANWTERENEYWFVNGVQATNNWNGKSF